jgi:hypothetical protein
MIVAVERRDTAGAGDAEQAFPPQSSACRLLAGVRIADSRLCQSDRDHGYICVVRYLRVGLILALVAVGLFSLSIPILGYLIAEGFHRGGGSSPWTDMAFYERFGATALLGFGGARLVAVRLPKSHT